MRTSLAVVPCAPLLWLPRLPSSPVESTGDILLVAVLDKVDVGFFLIPTVQRSSSIVSATRRGALCPILGRNSQVTQCRYCVTVA